MTQGMAGCDKIAEQILEEAREAARQRVDEAKATATARIEEARHKAQEQADVVRADAKEQGQSLIRAAHSAAALTVRNAGLRQRRRELEETLAATLAWLNALPDNEYFERLYPLLRRSVQPGNGILRLNARDLARKPVDFDERVRDELTAAEVDGTVTVSGVPCGIDGGFMLQYGEVEINAAFSSLLEEKREALEDLLNRELFGACV